MLSSLLAILKQGEREVTEAQDIQREFQYPIEFRKIISRIFINIPRLAHGLDSYSGVMKSNPDGDSISISFVIRDEKENEDEIRDRIGTLIDFIRERGLDGIAYNEENGELIFNDAGRVVQAITDYVSINPDNLDGEILTKINAIMSSIHHDEVSEKKNENKPLQYPECAHGIILGFISYLSFKTLSDSVYLSYSEDQNTDQGGHVITMTCADMDGENFPDPDTVEELEELCNEITILRPKNIKVELNGQYNEKLVIQSTSPLVTLTLLKSLYRHNEMQGSEDVLRRWDHDKFIDTRFDQAKKNIFPDNIEKDDPAYYALMRRQVLLHYNKAVVKMQASVIDEMTQDPDYDDGDELLQLPINAVSESVQQVLIQLFIGVQCNARYSIMEVEARILNELQPSGMTRHQKARNPKFNIH